MLGRYRLEEPLGQGGMAEVWRATDTRLTRPVAVKVIHASIAKDPQFAERFLREARVVASLEHPNILPVYDFGDEDGLPYLVMPLLSGGTLRDRLRTAPPPPALAAAWIRELADALDAAHAAGVLHRDVKPANVLLGKGDRLFLADFGIAKMVETMTGLTATGVVVGTPTYMAPEQAQGQPASAATDRYALAAVAFEILAGRPPFDGENPLSLMHQHVTMPPPALSSKAAGFPPGLDAVFDQALAKDPAKRPPSCRALADAVAALLPTGPSPVVSATGAAATPAPFSAPFPSGTAPTVLQPRDGTAPTVLQPRERTPRPSPSLTSEATILTTGRKKRRALLWTATAVAAGVVALGFFLKGRRTQEPAPAAATTGGAATTASAPAPAAAASPAATTASSPITLVEIPSSVSASSGPAASRAPDPEDKRIADLEKRVQRAETEAREAREAAASAAAPRPTEAPPPTPAPPAAPTAAAVEEAPDQAPAHPAMAAIRERLDVRTKPARRLAKEDFEFVAQTAQAVVRERPKNAEARFYLTFAQGGLAYVAGKDAIASAVAAEAVAVLKRTNRQEHRALAQLLTRPDGTIAPPHGWELAIAYGDARGEAMGLLDAALRENPRDQRALRARAMLRKLRGLDPELPAGRRR